MSVLLGWGLVAVGGLLALGGALAGALEWVRRRPWADVLDMIEPPRVVMPLRCICTGRRSFCDCAIDGVRNPRGAGRARIVTLDPDERIENGVRIKRTASRAASAWAGQLD